MMLRSFVSLNAKKLLIFWGLLSLGLSGCGDAGNTDPGQDGGWPDGQVGCQYALDVSPVSPLMNELMTISVVGTGNCTPMSYTWTARDPDQQAVALTLRPPDERIAEFYPTKSGPYVVTVDVTDYYYPTQHPSTTIIVAHPAGDRVSYLFRFTPPGDVNAPRQQQVLVVTGQTPISGRIFTLDEGVAVSNRLAGPSGPFGGYLRLVQRGFPLYREIRVPAHGEFQVAILPGQTYDVMVIPDDPAPAPARLMDLGLTELTSTMAFTFDNGEPVIGYVRDDVGAPVVGAQAVLRSQGLPSAVDTADIIDGRFVLYARPGPQALEIAPPEGSGLPVAVVPEAAGVLLEAGVDLGLAFDYAALPIATVSLRVTAGAAGPAVPEARVSLEATSLGPVGELTVTRDGTEVATVPADGHFRLTAFTNASGELPALAVPAGTFRVVIDAPPDVPSGYTTTVIESLNISGPGPVALDLSLAPPALLEGTVVNDRQEPVEAVKVIAITHAGVGSAVQARTATDGGFSLPVIRGATYTLLCMPDVGTHLARQVLESVPITDALTVVQGAGPAGEIVLPNGLSIAGEVLFLSQALGGVLVQAIPSGVTGEPVLAEAVTDLGGAFTLVVPDPGLVE